MKPIIIMSLFTLVGVSCFASIRLVNAFSETFPLVESASVSRIVFANAGERIVGDFTVLDVPTWNDPYTGNPETVQYAFKIAKIENPMDIDVFVAIQQEHSSFDITCKWTGNYILRFNVGRGQVGEYIGHPTLGIGNMKATLNYNVVSASHSIPSQPETSSIDLPNWIFPLLGGATICIVIAIMTSVYRKKRMSSGV